MDPTPYDTDSGQDRHAMKMRVARTLKWNVIDKVASQILYAVTGLILAWLLDQADFGLIGAILVFQAFATMFVDSGFSYALIQRKHPTQTDYSTILWFNISAAIVIYVILFFCAPLIAEWFQNDRRIIPLSRVMFLTFIINATAIVQTNRLMKMMNVRLIAISNSIALIAAAAAGISLAFAGAGPWALVWQAVTLATVKSAILWIGTGWTPSIEFSFASLRSFFRVGTGMMGATFLNILFQNIYSFFIGNRTGMVPLGYYTQADKWSKMGISSISSALSSSFLPALAQYQDTPTEFASATAKMNRLTSYLIFPACGIMIVIATPAFHALFGHKWDASILLFQLLMFRGIFTVLTTIYQNFVMSLGQARMIVMSEVIRDSVAIAAIAVTLPYIAISRQGNLTEGIAIFLWGQVAASIIAWGAMLWIASRRSGRTPWQFLTDSLPYATESLLVVAVIMLFKGVTDNPWLLIAIQLTAGISLYMLINRLAGSRIQSDLVAYIRRKG